LGKTATNGGKRSCNAFERASAIYTHSEHA
jgi:hypothetical protein